MFNCKENIENYNKKQEKKINKNLFVCSWNATTENWRLIHEVVPRKYLVCFAKNVFFS